MKQKTPTILLWLMIGTGVLWVLFMLSYLTAVNGPLEAWAWGVLLLITAPMLIALLVILWYLRVSLLPTKKDCDPILHRFMAGMTVAFALLTLTVSVARFLLDSDSVSYPWSYIALSSTLQNMGLAFGALTLVSVTVGSLWQFVIRNMKKSGCERAIAAFRRVGIGLTVLIALFVLFAPFPSGRYHDGGSQRFESVFYEVIDWNRTKEFDGTPFYEKNQTKRVYFFPFNCYEYQAKWDLRH